MSRLRRSPSPICARAWIALFSASIVCVTGCAETPPVTLAQVQNNSGPAALRNDTRAPAIALADEVAVTAAAPDPDAARDETDKQSAAGATIVLTQPQRVRADGLYAQHCAACHGVNGDGNGLAARFLFPKPRDFRSGHFRLVSTTNTVPTASDLDLVLVRGMPGSSMPPWPNLSREDRQLLAARVIEFRREGIREHEQNEAKKFGDEVDEAEVAELVHDLTTPGPLVEVPALPARTPESIARGRNLYMTRGCAGCHADDGTGRVQQKMVDAEGLPSTARDLTKGIFKGNPDEVSIYRRTQTGIPGTPMPATSQMTHDEISSLVHYVLSLSDEKTRNETILNRTTVDAALMREVPEEPDDPRWQQVKSVRLRMTPLWWRNDFDPFLDVRAVHDGQSLALSLSWGDLHPDTHVGKVEAFRDAAAVQLFQGDAEPFLGMGTLGQAVELWLWDAGRQQKTAGDVEAANPNIVVDNYPPSEGLTESPEYSRPATRTAAQNVEFLSARAAGNPFAPVPGGPAASTLEAGGPGTATFRPPMSQLVRSKGVWKDGRWNVVLVRPLSGRDSAISVPLKPGSRASLAFAVWDGGHRDRDGMKLITIWQDLVLQSEK